MKKVVLVLFIILFTSSFAKNEKLYNIKVTKEDNQVGKVINYSTISPNSPIKQNDIYFFSLGNEKIYLNSFLVKVEHEKEEYSKQFYNYFILRVKKSQEAGKTNIEKIFKEENNIDKGVFIFSCYENISKVKKTPIYYNIFYRNEKNVSIIRLAKKEDIKNLIEYLILNNILNEEEKNYINLVTENIK